MPATSLVNYVRSYDPDRISDDKMHHYDLQASGSIHLFCLADMDPSCLHLRHWKITVLTVEPNRRLDNLGGFRRYCFSDGQRGVPRHLWIPPHFIYLPPVSKSPKSLPLANITSFLE